MKGRTQPADLSQTRAIKEGKKEKEFRRSEIFDFLWPGIDRAASEYLPGPHV